jgi:hypothetical protein
MFGRDHDPAVARGEEQMQPRTSVRQPIIAGARRQQLSELLRQWRKQPRKRSPLLFWTLLSLALMCDGGLLFFAARSLESWDPSSWLAPRLVYEKPPYEQVVARPALYLGLLTVGFFTAAGAVRQRGPQWRRRFLFAGLLVGLGCLGWSAATLFGPTIADSTKLIGNGGQEMLWSAAVVMGLGLSLAVLFRDAFLALTGALVSSLGFLAASYWPSALAELWPPLVQGAAEDIYLHVQVWMLLSAYAALALAWGLAALTLARVLLAAPSNERLRRLAFLSLWLIRLGMLLLAASALLDGWRAIPGFLDPTLRIGTHRWNAQALGTLLVLPGCLALFYARRRGWLPPFHWLAAVTLGFPLLAMMGHIVGCWGAGELHTDFFLTADVGFYVAGLFPLSLTAHAALRFYFGRQRILEV